MVSPANANFNTAQMQRPQAFRGGGGYSYEPQQQGDLTSGVTASPELKSDTVEISSAKDNIETPQKKGMSKGAKVGIGIAGSVATIATAGLLVMKHDHNKLMKFGKDKIKLSELPEYLEYKATTKEEALKFAKETLGIKEIDETFTDLALHNTLKGIVDVSNANKGRVYIPSKLKFVEMEGGIYATANRCVTTDAYGTLSVNKKFYDDNFLTKNLNKMLATSKKINGTTEISIDFSDKFKGLIDRFMESSKNMTLAEKQELYLMLCETCGKAIRLTNPETFLNHFKNDLRNVNITYDYDKILKLPSWKQREEIAKLASEYNNITGNNLLSVKATLNNPLKNIYHEMGHLQDF